MAVRTIASLFLLAAPAVNEAAAVTPIQKVAQMLDGMIAKGKGEKHTEETEFAEFQQWCDSTREATKKSIAEGEARIQQLEADIIKAEADAEDAAAASSELLAKADAEQADADGATAIRKKENADYEATHADLSESIDAIERAISVLKSREADVPQSLLQLSHSLKSAVSLPADAKSTIDALLALSSGQAPAANAYEFQSGGVVATLEKLRLKFQDELLAVQKAEIAAKSNYEVLFQRLTDSIKDAKERAAAKTAFKSQRLEDAAGAKGDLSVTQKAKAEDEKTLSETLSACDARSREFENNQVVRSGEIKACEQAVGILRSDAVSGNADKHLPSFTQAVSLVQLRGVEMSETTARVVEFLQGRAKELGSRYLSLAASHVAADPFVKVKKMIKDLIVKLMEEANSEADHNAYCTTELATNKLTRENKQSEIDELSAHVDKKTAESQQLASQLATLSEEVAELKRQQADATNLRDTERKTNAATVADAKEAQVAVEKATKILKDFFASASDASAALLQNGGEAQLSEEMSQASKAPYTGQQSSNTGIVGFLEVILSDFARLESETSSAEDQAQELFEKFMNETNQDVAVKETEIKHKDNSKLDCDQTIASLQKELQLTQEELAAADNYYQKLKPDCVDTGLSYEVRVQKREEEIQSLKEAMKILTQEDLS
jgi:hypothetical protein